MVPSNLVSFLQLCYAHLAIKLSQLLTCPPTSTICAAMRGKDMVETSYIDNYA